MAKSVSVVGLSPASRDLVFQEPEGSEIWSLNNGHLCFTPEQMKRFTAWFQIHPREDYEGNHNPALGHKEWLKTCGIPLYMEQLHEDIPTGIVFPRDDIVQSLGYDYFTSTIAYMVAFAIYKGYEEIRLYGIDMAAETEYFHERPCLEFWLGIAHERKIHLVFPENCPILRGREYGQTITIKSTMVNRMLRNAEQHKEELRAEFNAACGRVAMLQELIEQVSDSQALQERLEKEVKQKIAIGMEMNVSIGAVQAFTDVLIEAMRPEKEEAQRLRNVAGQGMAPELLPELVDLSVKRGVNGTVPKLREFQVVP